MKIRRILALVMTLALACCVGCGNSAKNEQSETQSATQAQTYVKKTVNVAVMKGPTAIGMAKLMSDAKASNTIEDYQFTVAAAADEFVGKLVKGDINIAAVPCNVAANLYNKQDGKIQVLAINTLGVLYIVENGNTINSLSDLKGKTIYSTGKGTTPEYTLRYLLKSAGIDPDKDVTLEFKSEATEVAAIIQKSGDSPVVAMLPQPYVTTVQNQNDKVRIALDVTKEWEKLNGSDSTVVTGVVVVNKEYAKANPDVIEAFVKEYKDSVAYVNANVDSAAQMVEDAGIFKAAIAKKAIPYCNITYIDGAEMQKKITAYLKVLYDENAASIGGKMPDEGFWYTK